jgi:hypothetical protein
VLDPIITYRRELPQVLKLIVPQPRYVHGCELP